MPPLKFDFHYFQFLSGKDESERDEDNKTALDKLKDSKQGLVKCRICKEDHWTSMCPYKDTLGPLQEKLQGTTGLSATEDTSAPAESSDRLPAGAAPGGKYVPPSKRGEGKVGDAMPDRRKSENFKNDLSFDCEL